VAQFLTSYKGSRATFSPDSAASQTVAVAQHVPAPEHRGAALEQQKDSAGRERDALDAWKLTPQEEKELLKQQVRLQI
jgi:hypothetical protein